MSRDGTIRWGIVGPGGIAERFVAAMADCDGGEVVAVASRATERAEAFAARHEIARAHGSVDDLIADDVDAVYVAVPHTAHHAVAVEALRAGRHVLCEKPMTESAALTGQVVAAARESGRFLMEAIWSRCLPAYRRLVEVLAEGRIGTPRLVDAELGFAFTFDAAGRLFDPALGGGALLDLGIYPLQLATLVLGPPQQVRATGRHGPTGVDELAAVLTTHAEGVGVLRTSARSFLVGSARIVGDDGEIELTGLVNDPRSLTVVAAGEREVIDCDYEGDGLRFEIDEVHRCLAEGLAESPLVPWADSLVIAGALDESIASVADDARRSG